MTGNDSRRGGSSIRDYASQASALEQGGQPLSRVSGAARRVVPAALRPLAKTVATWAITPYTRSKATKLQRHQATPRLHLGSGRTKLEGWINVDLAGAPADLIWDLRKGLPFPNGSVDCIFHEHLLEHIPLEGAISLTLECSRVLREGGVLRVGVPDFGRYMRSYSGDGVFLDETRPGRPTPLLAVAEVAFAHGHRSVWDADTLSKLMGEASLKEAREVPWGTSRISPVPDSPSRRNESLYVEAIA